MRSAFVMPSPSAVPALPAAVFAARRRRLLDEMPAGALLILPAASLATRSRDTEYPFRQDSDFWYLTGYEEPDALLVLAKGRQAGEQLLFNQTKDRLLETWTGIRLGQEAAVSQLAFDQAFTLAEVDRQLPELLAVASEVWLPLDNPALQGRYQGWRQQVRALRKRIARLPDRLVDLSVHLGEQRLIKQPEEIERLREAARISAVAHCRAMQACRPGLLEYQLQAELEHEFRIQGASGPSYGSIVGAGTNACVLHYVENSAVMQDGDLVLIDAGAEFQGYAGDITRTFPVNGRFSPRQRQLYQLVLNANELAISRVKPGTTLDEIHQAVLRCLVDGLLQLGLLQGDAQQLIDSEAYKAFYMHGTSHWLGLDVHDVGLYRLQDAARPLEPGMVFTIEPGLYIAPDQAGVDSDWRGIGIRVEDDILVTATACEVLTHGVPKTIEGIEELMAGAHATDTQL